MKLLSALTYKTYKLWVKWDSSYYLKRQYVYTFGINSNTSWLLGKIFDTRDLLTIIAGWEAVVINGKFCIKKAYSILKGYYTRWIRGGLFARIKQVQRVSLSYGWHFLLTDLVNGMLLVA